MRKTTYITPAVTVCPLKVEGFLAASLEIKDDLTKEEQEDVDLSDKSNRKFGSGSPWSWMDEEE